ncbi:unnamed protein product [Hyaloperonospora brassicae]|uniref:RNase H type-1 domain-containing protein n=1 Tax=Hyaloperonospora brassicae TaxID=162125 RepID=A0AAV0UWQ0_HYABA|nr:unnamed protein product [Hyaloperonospora brassicae]
MQRTKEGKHERDREIAVQSANNSELQSAAAQLLWSGIRTVTGEGAATVQTLCRIKANNLNLWNYVHSDRSCSHSASWTSPTCRHARGRQSKNVSLRPVMNIATFSDQSTLQALVNASVDNAFLYFVSLTYKYDTDEQTAHKRAVMGALAARLTEPTAEPIRTPPISSRSLHLLSFDGGSRRNPGPRGSGSAMVRVDTDTHSVEIIWVASISYVRAYTTNNTAEYWELIHGIRRAEADQLTPLHVVGDSAMIIQQMRRLRLTRHHRLRPLY